MKDKYYIYAYRCPETKAIRYIGKGSGTRARHLSRRYGHCKSWIKSLKNRNLSPEIIILKSRLTESVAFELETLLIKVCKRLGFNLTNMTDGGDGSSGHKHSILAKEKMSKTYFKSGQIPWNKGRLWDVETKHKMSVGRKGIKAKLSPEGKRRQLDTLFASHEKRRKPIIGVHKKTGKIIEFNSQGEAATQGFSQSEISYCCSNEFGKFSHKNYYWRFKNDNNGRNS